MAMPPQQQQQFQQKSQHSKPFRNLFNADSQMPSQFPFFSPASFADQSQPQYIPPFHVAGFAPVPATDGGGDLQWISGFEPKRKRLKEEDFFDSNNIGNNLQMPSVDFFSTQPVSTGLGLSLDNRRMISSLGESHDCALVGDDINQELQRQDADIDRLIKVEGEQLRQAILKKVQANNRRALSLLEERIVQKLRQREAEILDIDKKNTELEEQVKQLTEEATAWQQQAMYNENMVNTLKSNLQLVLTQTKASIEGCGDSEVDDTASFCNGGARLASDFHLACKENKDFKDLMTCKVCRVNEVCMLLLPCRHLCLCKVCESKLSFCPLCQTSKYIGMEVYM